MSSSSKKRKNKWKTVAVEEILPNAVVRPTTSWAEEVESELNEYTIKKISSISLPTAPRATCDLVIDESKIPPNGPFNAYLSNLPYEITEEDIAQQFKELKVAGIQLPKDSRHDRMRGFGYVEFKDKSSLLTALNEGELTLKGRLVRISLPSDEEQNKDRGSRSGGVSFSRRDVSDRIEGSDKNLGEWRAAAPIPHDPDKGGFTRSGAREGGTGGPFREPRAFDPEPSSAFSRGGRNRDGFQERNRDGFQERNRDGFQERNRDGFQERNRDGFQDRDRDGFRERGGFRDRNRDGFRDNDRDSDRGGSRLFGKRYEKDDRSGSRMSFGKRFDHDDREFVRREQPPSEKEEPKSRPKLEIQPRTKPLEPSVPEALPSSIFGGAKPVDTLKREMEIEAKLSSLAVSQPPARSRGSTPPLRSTTPMSNRSRSSSVSSMSSCRRQDVDSAENVHESHQTGQSDDESKDHSYKNTDHEFKEPPPPPPKNVWEQRKAASAAAAAESTVPDSSSVIEKSNVYENSVDVNVENRSRNEDASKRSPNVGEQRTETSSGPADCKNINARPTMDKDCNSDDGFIRYEPDHFSNPDTSQQSGRAGRYNDSKFNFNRERDNRRDRGRDNRNGRRPDNGNQFGRRSENSFGQKWNSNRDRNSGPGGRKFSERDNNYAFRDRHESGSNFSNRSSFSSSNTNLRDDGDARTERNDRRNDERLNDDHVSSNDARIRDDEKFKESTDERSKIVNDDSVSKTIENGNENGVNSEDVARKSNESIAIISEQSELNDNSFSSSKSRKRDKKKKNQEKKDTEQVTEKNQKDEKKRNVDNHQVNDKANNKNNVKNKDSKPSKKNRELRDDVTQLPKAKEEKAPNFQDSNRFLFLDNDD